MLIKIVVVLALTVLAVCLFFVYLSMTAKAPELGLSNGRLSPCPDSPNCVSSEPGTDAAHRVDPLHFAGTPEQAWLTLKQAIEALGGKVTAETSAYLRAEFTSRIFRFIDDLECRLQPQDKLIHLRSASRVGHSDLGVNRTRIESLQKLFSAMLLQGTKSIRRP